MNSPNTPTRRRTPSRAATDPDLVDRLARLRTILPLIATDLACARRHTHTLELENQRLARRIAELESKLAPTGNQANSPQPATPNRSPVS